MKDFQQHPRSFWRSFTDGLFTFKYTIVGMAISGYAAALSGWSPILAVPPIVGVLADAIESWLWVNSKASFEARYSALIEEAKRSPRDDNPEGYTDWYHPYEVSEEEEAKMKEFEQQIREILNKK